MSSAVEELLSPLLNAEWDDANRALAIRLLGAGADGYYYLLPIERPRLVRLAERALADATLAALDKVAFGALTIIRSHKSLDDHRLVTWANLAAVQFLPAPSRTEFERSATPWELHRLVELASSHPVSPAVQGICATAAIPQPPPFANKARTGHRSARPNRV